MSSQAAVLRLQVDTNTKKDISSIGMLRPAYSP